MIRNHLVLFARYPQLGRGKRRLAAGIGAVAAWRFYRTTLVTLVRRLARDRRWTVTIAVTPERAVWAGGWPRGVRRAGQGGGDLGTRMARCLRRAAPGRVAVIGSDLPDLCAAHVAAAFRCLAGRDFVFGPAGDGGYWLVGARRTAALPRTLFRDVRWSTVHALADTVSGLPRRATVGYAPTLDDVDDADDYARWRRRVTVL